MNNFTYNVNPETGLVQHTQANVPLPDNYLYISHLDGLGEDDEDDFKFWYLPFYPETIADTMQSTFTPTQALGRSAPVYTFSNAGPRTVQINVELHRDIMDDINMSKSNAKLGVGEDYVDNLVHALQAISLPKYNLNNKAVEPPLVALRLGNEVFIKGVVTSSIGITYITPILSNNRYAQIKLSFTVSEVDPYDATSVYKNGSFRGLVRTLKPPFNSKGD